MKNDLFSSLYVKSRYDLMIIVMGIVAIFAGIFFHWAISLLGVIAVLIALFYEGFYSIEVGHVGVIKFMGKPRPYIKNAGPCLVKPFIEMVETINVQDRAKNIEGLKSNTQTHKDVHYDISFVYTPNALEIPNLLAKYKGVEEAFEVSVMTHLNSVCDNVFAPYTYEELDRKKEDFLPKDYESLTPEEKAEADAIALKEKENFYVNIAKKILDSLQAKDCYREEFFSSMTLSISNWKFDPAYEETISTIATTKLETEKVELLAKQQQIAAEGLGKAELIKSEYAAKSIAAKGAAENQVTAERGASLTPIYVQEQVAVHMPKVYSYSNGGNNGGNNGGITTMLDINGMLDELPTVNPDPAATSAPDPAATSAP